MALSADKNTQRGKVMGRTAIGLIRTGYTPYKGSYLAWYTDGTLMPISSLVASLRPAGVCVRSEGLGDGVKKAVVERRGTEFFACSGASAAWVGLPAYLTDDATVAIVAPTGTGGYDYVAGKIVQCYSSTLVEVDLEELPLIGVSAGTISRTQLASETATIQVPLTSFRTIAALAALPTAGDSTSLGLVAGTVGSASAQLAGTLSSGNSHTETARALVAMPKDYVDAGAVNLVVHCRVDGTLTAAQTLTVTAYKGDKEIGVGSQLVTGGAQNVPATWGNLTFPITATTLVRGDVLDIKLSAVANDTGGTVNKNIQIGDVRLTMACVA